MIEFNINLGLASQTFSNLSNEQAENVYHRISWKFGVAPSAGTYTISIDNGDGIFVAIPEATNKSLTQGSVAVIAGNMKSVKIDLAGVTGGSGAVLTIRSTEQFPGEGGLPRGVFNGLRAVGVQGYTEINVKTGSQWEFAVYNAALAAGANLDFIVTTGALPVSIKGRYSQFDGGGISTVIYRAPTFSGGTVTPYYNLNYKNANTGLSVIRTTPTVTAVGTQVSPVKTYLGSTGTGNSVMSSAVNDPFGLENVLAPNTTYLFRLTSIGAAAQRVASYVTWYEGNLDLPVV